MTAKVRTRPGDPLASLRAALAALGLGWDDVAILVHGTTLVTNAIIEDRLPPVALVATAGFADVLAIGRQNRRSLYSLGLPPKLPPMVPEGLRFELKERMGPDGKVKTPLEAAAPRAAGRGRPALGRLLGRGLASPRLREPRPRADRRRPSRRRGPSRLPLAPGQSGGARVRAHQCHGVERGGDAARRQLSRRARPRGTRGHPFPSLPFRGRHGLDRDGARAAARARTLRSRGRRLGRPPGGARAGTRQRAHPRHGRHHHRCLPHPARQAGAPPGGEPGRPAGAPDHGRGAVDRRRRRLDRLCRGRHAAGRAAKCRRQPRPGLLRPGRHASRP